MSHVLMRPGQGIAATAATAGAARRLAIYAEQPIASKRARRRRIAVDVEPFWKLAKAALPAAAGDAVVEPMVSLDGNGRPLVELRAYDADQLGKRLIAAYAALEG